MGYVVSLYFLSFERIQLANISPFFHQLFCAKHYNVHYHYYHDAVYWSTHFAPFCKVKQQKQQKSLQIYEDNEDISRTNGQFAESALHLSSKNWSRFTKNERFQLKFFLI